MPPVATVEAVPSQELAQEADVDVVLNKSGGGSLMVNDVIAVF